MMKINECNLLYQSLENELNEISVMDEPVLKSYALSIEIIRMKILEFNKAIAGYRFEDQFEEIEMYKSVYTQFYKLFIYYVELFNVEKGAHFADKYALITYYNDHIKRIDLFFRQNSFMYQYHRLNASDLDSLYFGRDSWGQSSLVPESIQLETGVSNSGAFFFAKIMAFEMLREDIQYKIDKLIKDAGVINNKMQQQNSLVWTGESINLVEIAYGIWLTGQFNHGNASLNQIFSWFETHFQIGIGKPQKRFVEIESRKRLSQTKFLDHMRGAILQKIDDGNR